MNASSFSHIKRVNSPQFLYSPLAILVALSILAGCSGSKPDTVSKPHVTWILAHKEKVAPDKFLEEVAVLFAPFQDQKECGQQDVYPQVDVAWISQKEIKQERVVDIDPDALASTLQNPVERLFGAPPRFDELETLVRTQIRTRKIPDDLANTGLAFPGSADLAAAIVSQKSNLDFAIVVRTDDAKVASGLASKLGRTTGVTGKVPVVPVGTGPEALRQELLKVICANGADKKPAKPIELLVVDLPASAGTLPIEVDQQEAVRAEAARAEAAKADAARAEATRAAAAKAEAARAAAARAAARPEATRTATPERTPTEPESTSPVRTAPARPPSELADCMPGTPNCEPLKRETLPNTRGKESK